MENDITNEKDYKGNKIVNSIIYNNKILEDIKGYIICDNKIFKLNAKQTKYYKEIKVKIQRLEIFKCKNARKHERERKADKLGEFCSPKIKKDTLNNKNNKFIYEFINNHSDSCLYIKNEINRNEKSL